jgi:hypothetical protein
MLTEADSSVPPAPAVIGSEFARAPLPPGTEGKEAVRTTAAVKLNRAEPAAINRAKLVNEIARYHSEIETYRQKLEEIEADFVRELTPLLTPEQRERFAAHQKRFADRRSRGIAALAADSSPLSDDQIFRLQQRPLLSVLGEVALSMRYDSLQRDLKFDDAQQAKVRELLRARRERFLVLIDSTPPPSIMLSRLAPVAQKLATEPKKQAPVPAPRELDRRTPRRVNWAMVPTVLIVDDEKHTREGLQQALAEAYDVSGRGQRRRGFQPAGHAAVRRRSDRPPHAGQDRASRSSTRRWRSRSGRRS